MRTNNANKRWTSYENKILIEMMSSGYTPEQAGKRLGRSPGAVVFQWRQLDPSRVQASASTEKSNPKNHRLTWTMRDEQVLLEMYDAGKSYEEIADALGRKPSSVKKYHERLRSGGVLGPIDYFVKQPSKPSKDVGYAVAFALAVSAFVFSLAALSL